MSNKRKISQVESESDRITQFVYLLAEYTHKSQLNEKYQDSKRVEKEMESMKECLDFMIHRINPIYCLPYIAKQFELSIGDNFYKFLEQVYDLYSQCTEKEQIDIIQAIFLEPFYGKKLCPGRLFLKSHLKVRKILTSMFKSTLDQLTLAIADEFERKYYAPETKKEKQAPSWIVRAK